MKIFSVIMLLTLLASCTTAKVEESQGLVEETTTKETVTDMSDAMDSLDNMEMDESKVQTVSYSYANPAMEVNMEISYNLDTEGKIDMLSITSDNYADITKFNDNAQGVIIGLTLEQASEIENIGGSSLTTDAFKEAIKTQL